MAKETEYKTFKITGEIKELLDHKKYVLISEIMSEFVEPAMEEENPTPEMIEEINQKALIAVNYIFKGVTACEIRKEGNRIYYKILHDGIMIFEYGIEGIE